MASLVDTNVLVYRVDPSYPRKQSIARELLRAASASTELRLAHQSVLEFVSVVTRPRDGGRPLLEPPDARGQATRLLSEFTVLYPDETVLRLALQGAETHQLPWYDAHMWAYAERYGLSEILSEDFQHGRVYGRVRAVNPFAE